MKEKIIFLDRDGTIIYDKEYVHKIEDLEFLPGAIEGLQKLSKDGYKFIIVTNQAGMARGYFSHAQASAFNDEMLLRLHRRGITILKTYMCLHHPKVSGDCACRKPNPGMVHQAIEDFKLDPSLCLFVGDKDCDIDLGAQFQARTFLVDNGQYEVKSTPSHRIKHLGEISEILEKEGPAGT